MQFLQLFLPQIYPTTFLSATGLSALIIVSTGIIKKYWKEWMTFRNENRRLPLSTDIPNVLLVFFTFLVANLAVFVALIETGQISDPATVWKFIELANSTAITSNGIYTIIKHSIIPWIKS